MGLSREGELVLGPCGNVNHLGYQLAWGDPSASSVGEEGRQELEEERHPRQRHPCLWFALSSDGGLKCHQEHRPTGRKCIWHLEADSKAVGFRSLCIVLP